MYGTRKGDGEGGGAVFRSVGRGGVFCSGGGQASPTHTHKCGLRGPKLGWVFFVSGYDGELYWSRSMAAGHELGGGKGGLRTTCREGSLCRRKDKVNPGIKGEGGKEEEEASSKYEAKGFSYFSSSSATLLFSPLLPRGCTRVFFPFMPFPYPPHPPVLCAVAHTVQLFHILSHLTC